MIFKPLLELDNAWPLVAALAVLCTTFVLHTYITRPRKQCPHCDEVIS